MQTYFQPFIQIVCFVFERTEIVVEIVEIVVPKGIQISDQLFCAFE